jgi:tRNA-splicing ligase RtcB
MTSGGFSHSASAGRIQERVESPVLDEIAECAHPFQKGLAQMAAQQLGTIGSGNHYVDLFEDEADGALWIGVHFGSRGFGHKTATWALERAGTKDDSMMAPPVVIPTTSELGALYLDAWSALDGTPTRAGTG